MNVEYFKKYNEVIILINELKKLYTSGRNRAKHLLKKYQEDGKHKVSNAFDTQSSFARLDELVKEEAFFRGITPPPQDSLTLFLKETALTKALNQLNGRLVDYALSHPLVVRQALSNVLPTQFVSYNRLINKDFKGFLRDVVKKHDIDDEDYKRLQNHLDEIEEEIMKLKDIHGFLDFMESYYDYREAEMQLFVKGNLKLFY